LIEIPHQEGTARSEGICNYRHQPQEKPRQQTLSTPHTLISENLIYFRIFSKKASGCPSNGAFVVYYFICIVLKNVEPPRGGLESELSLEHLFLQFPNGKANVMTTARVFGSVLICACFHYCQVLCLHCHRDWTDHWSQLESQRK